MERADRAARTGQGQVPADRQLHRRIARHGQRRRQPHQRQVRTLPDDRGGARGRRHMTTAPAAASRAWLINALITVVLWGVWGAFSDQSPKHGFPDTLVYCVWALSLFLLVFFVLCAAGRMLVCCL